MHTSNLYYTEPQLELAELLVASAFPSRVFFCNSGAEANEGAIKLARKWGKMHRDGAHVIVCAQGAFHGRTMGALAATANPRYRKQFEPLPKGFVHIPYGDLEALEQSIDSATCAVMLEPIEGESGVIPLEPGGSRRSGGCAMSATCSSSSTRSRPAWDAPAAGGPTSTRTRRRTS